MICNFLSHAGVGLIARKNSKLTIILFLMLHLMLWSLRLSKKVNHYIYMAINNLLISVH